MPIGKVASYIKNLGKSVAYASIDVFDEAMPATKEYRQANAAVAKEIYHAITNFRGTVKKVAKYTKESRVYDAVSYGISNTLEDLSTGNFYNKQREQSKESTRNLSAAMTGSADTFDMNMDDMFKDMDKMFSDEEEKSLDAGDKATIKSIEGTAKASANTIANATVTAAKYQSEVAKVNNNILFAQQERLFGQLNSGISTMNDNVNTINKFNMDVFQKHIENSTKFFDVITNNSNKMVSLFDEFMKMYRAEYKIRDKARAQNEKAMANRKHNEDEPATYSDLANSFGSVDFGEYIGNVQKQFFKQLNDQFGGGQKLFGPGAEGNILRNAFDNPLGDLMKWGINGLIGPALKHSMESFDRIMSGVFGTAMARLNTWSRGGDDEMFSGRVKEWIGKIFGTNDPYSKVKTSMDTSKYVKGAIPFDGVTKKAITEVIPELLGDILSEISGGEHRRFNYSSGSWTTLEQITKAEKRKADRAERAATGKIDRLLQNATILSQISSSPEEQLRILEAINTNFHGYIKGKSGDLGEAYKMASTSNNEKFRDFSQRAFGGQLTDEVVKKILSAIKNNFSQFDLMNMPGEYMANIGAINKERKNKIITDDDISHLAFNNSRETMGSRRIFVNGKGETTIESAQGKVFDKNGHQLYNARHTLAAELDEHGNNIFNYLQNIESSITGLYQVSTQYYLNSSGYGITSRTPFNFSTKKTEDALKLINTKLGGLQYKVRSKTARDVFKIATDTDLTTEDWKSNPEDVATRRGFLKDRKKFFNLRKTLMDDLNQSPSDIDPNKIDAILKERTGKIKLLEKYIDEHKRTLTESLIPGMDNYELVAHLKQDLANIKAKAPIYRALSGKGRIGTTAGSGLAIGSRSKKIIDLSQAQREKDIKDDGYASIVKAAAGKDGTFADALQNVFEQMLKANDETEEDGVFTSSHASTEDAFESAKDAALRKLHMYGLDLDSAPGQVLIQQLIEKWNMHYAIPGFIKEEAGEGNSFYTFTRGKKAEDDLKARLSKNEDFSWNDFSKKSFSEKFSSVNTFEDKWDVVMMQVGKMVEFPAKIMTNVFTAAGNSIFSFFFNDETDYIDKDGKKITGFFNLLKAKTVNALDSFVTGFDKHIWSPIKEQFGLSADSLSNSLGISWLVEKYGKATKNAFVQLEKNVMDLISGGALEKANEKEDEKETDEEKAEKKSKEQQKQEKDYNIITNLLEKGKYNDVEENAKGARIINKTGLTAISKGEMIIPSELNPFYKGKTNKKEEIRKEDQIRKDFGGTLANLIGRNAEGAKSYEAGVIAPPTTFETYKAILDNLKLHNPKVYAEVAAYANDAVDDNNPFKDESRSKMFKLLDKHLEDRTPEQEVEYQKQRDLKATGTMVKRITEFNQSMISKVVLDTKNPTVIKLWDSFIKNDAETVGNGVAGGALGALVGLLTGFGPLAGMVIGAGANIVMGSETVKSTLFGDKDAKGERSGGALLSATEYKYLTKLIPDIGKFGLIGAGAGLVGLAPFGILGGLGIGAMAAFAKNSTSFMDSMFGDVDGIINKEKQDFLKKALPNMAIGSVATFALGPFGLLGSVLLGSAGGMIATSEKFKSIMLGDKLFDGTRSGGLLTELKDRFISPLAKFAKDFTVNMSQFVYNDIIKPFAEGVGPIVRLTGIAVKNTANTLMDGVKKLLGLTPEGSILKDIWTAVARPAIEYVGGKTGGLVNTVFNKSKKIISYPSRLVQKAGIGANAWMMNRGYGAGMTAEQRAAYAQDHKFGFFGRGSKYRDNDLTMMNMKDQDMINADNLARYIASNGEGTEKILSESKDNLKTNLRSILGVSNLTKGQDEILNNLLSDDENVRQTAMEKVETMLDEHHVKDKRVRDAFRSTIDVMQQQKVNLDKIRNGGIDAAKDSLAAMGFKGITNKSEAQKLSALFGTEIKDRGILNKLAEVAESQTPAEKQLTATELAGEKNVEATKEAALSITQSTDNIGEILNAISEQFTEYLKDPEKFRKDARDFDNRVASLSEQIRLEASVGGNRKKLAELQKQKNELIARDALKKQFMAGNVTDDEVSMNTMIGSIMTNGDKKYITGRDRAKLHTLYYKEDFVKRAQAVKDSNLWTDSLSTILHLDDEKLPLIKKIGQLQEKYNTSTSRWYLTDALAFNESDVPTLEKLMSFGKDNQSKLPSNLSWYVDHKSQLGKVENLVDTYKKIQAKSKTSFLDTGIYNEELDSEADKSKAQVSELDKVFANITNKDTRSKDAGRMISASLYKMGLKEAQEKYSDKDREKDLVHTTAPDGTPLTYVRSTDGSLVAADKDTEKFIKEQRELKWYNKDLTGMDKIFGSHDVLNKDGSVRYKGGKTKFGSWGAKDFLQRKKSDIGYFGKSVGNALGATGGFLSAILGPILGFGGKVVLGGLAGGFLLKKFPALAEAAANILYSGIKFVGNTAISAFSYVLEHAGDIAKNVYEIISDSISGIVKVIFGTDRTNEELVKEKGIIIDEQTGKFYRNARDKAADRAMTEKEIAVERSRKSIFGALGDVWDKAGESETGRFGRALGATAAAGYGIYKAVKGAKSLSTWGRTIADKYHKAGGGWSGVWKAGGQLFSGAKLSTDPVESQNQNTSAVDKLTTTIEDLITVLRNNGNPVNSILENTFGFNSNGGSIIDSIPGASKPNQSKPVKRDSKGRVKHGRRKGKVTAANSVYQAIASIGGAAIGGSFGFGDYDGGSVISDMASSIPTNLTTMPTGGSSSSIVEKIMNWVKKIPFLNTLKGAKSILGKIGSFLGKVGLRALPIGALIAAGTAIHSAWYGFTNAEALAAQSGVEPPEKDITPGFTGKCICGIASAIEELTMGIVPASSIVGLFSADTIYAEFGKSIKEFGSKVWEGTKAAGSSVLEGAKTVGSYALRGLQTAWDGYKAVGSTLWNGAKTVGSDLWAGAKMVGSDLWSGIKTVGSDTLDGIRASWDLTKEVGLATWNGIKMVGSDLWSGAKTVGSDLWSGIKTVGSDAIEGIKACWELTKEVGSAAWDGLSAIGSGLWNGAKNIGTAAWNKTKEVGSAAWDGIKNISTLVFNKIKDSVMNIGNAISDAIGNICSYLKEHAMDFMSNIWKTFKDGVSGFFASLFGGANTDDEHMCPKCGTLFSKDGIITQTSYSPDAEEKYKDQMIMGAGKYGRGYFKQTDPRFANMRFNTTGDSKYQTVGDSGCGPVAAVNALYGTGLDPMDASKFALENGYKEVNGGTKPGFFKSYFNKYGKDAEFTKNNQNILDNLAAGNRVVLEGQSNKIDLDTPFGTGPHYVTATGLDNKGNIIIQDPQDRRSNLAYDADKVLSKTKFGVAAKGKYGRGPEESESSKITNEILNKLVNPFGFNADGTVKTNTNSTGGDAGATRAAKKVQNNIDKKAINNALVWANNRINTKGEGRNGCTTFVGDFLSHANNKQPDWMWVPNIVQDAKLSSIWKDPSKPAKPGDIVVLDTDGNKSDGDHVVVATGDGDYIGNSSSKNKIIKGNIASSFGSENVLGYVETGNPDKSGTVTKGKIGRSAAAARAEAGPTSGAGKFGRGKFNPKASVSDFVYSNNAENYEYGTGAEEISNNYRQNVQHKAEQTAAAMGNSIDYKEELKQILAVLSDIEKNTRGGNEIGSQNREALNKIAQQTAKRITKGNASGAGKLSASDSLEDTEDMVASMYALAKR